MATALRDHWQLGFAAEPVDETKVANSIHTRMPKDEMQCIGAPAKPQIKAFLQRALPSAPGPDCLPCSAWLARDGCLADPPGGRVRILLLWP
eukprot:4457017-Pyramimonas_sp.AAC.1